jgi:biotin carboxyl carrier protein
VKIKYPLKIIGEIKQMNEFIATINEKKHIVKFSGRGKVEINGKSVSAELIKINSQSYLLQYENKVFEVTSNKIDKDRFGFLIEGQYFDTVVRTRLQETINELLRNEIKFSHNLEVRAPMPGLILKLLKQRGDNVKTGEPLLILEAMKMENEIRSVADGIVKEIHVKEGTSVEKSTLILTIV